MKYVTELAGHIMAEIIEVSDIKWESGCSPTPSDGACYRFLYINGKRLQQTQTIVGGYESLISYDFVSKCAELVPRILKPQDCPNCGYGGVMKKTTPRKRGYRYCSCCGLSGPHAKTPDEAIENWNQIKVEKKGAPVTRKEQKISPCPHCGSVDCVWPL